LNDDLFKSLLEEVFGQSNVLLEWDAAKDSKDALDKRLQYRPRIDYAIRPLNIDIHTNYNNELINKAYEKFRDLISEIKGNGQPRTQLIENNNPRCFLAIEYEKNPPSRKHTLGSMINACVMGKIGIIVAIDQKILGRCIRIVEYLQYLQENKNLLNIQNCIVIEKEGFESILRKYVSSSNKVP
jgi:hypothetical protein